MTVPASSLKPGLTTIPRTQEWWDAAGAGRVLIQRCDDCGHAQHYPRVLCTTCWSEALRWEEVSGRGTVWTFTVVHRSVHPAWTMEVPYVLAVVELDEGPRLMTNVLIDPSNVRVGLRVRAVAHQAPGDPVPLLRFTPTER